MRTYLIVSSIFFDLLAIVQLLRFIFGWPVMVAGFNVPVWASGIAFVVLAALSLWPIRLLIKDQRQIAAV